MDDITTVVCPNTRKRKLEARSGQGLAGRGAEPKFAAAGSIPMPFQAAAGESRHCLSGFAPGSGYSFAVHVEVPEFDVGVVAPPDPG
jgi:hypothetical protein